MSKATEAVCGTCGGEIRFYRWVAPNNIPRQGWRHPQPTATPHAAVLGTPAPGVKARVEAVEATPAPLPPSLVFVDLPADAEVPGGCAALRKIAVDNGWEVRVRVADAAGVALLMLREGRSILAGWTVTDDGDVKLIGITRPGSVLPPLSAADAKALLRLEVGVTCQACGNLLMDHYPDKGTPFGACPVRRKQ